MAGVVLGLAMALMTGRFIESLLHEVEASDAATLAATIVVLVSAGALAALVPTYRAVRLSPASRLRGD